MDKEMQPLGRNLKIIFMLVGVLTFGVGMLMFFLPDQAGVGTALADGKPAGDQWWPWPLRTALNTRFLGALFIGVGVGAFWSAMQRTWGQVRGLFPPALTFTALATAAAFLHRSSFNSQRITTWAFFAIYIIVLIAGLVAYLRYERRNV
jgi:hypothetical protein